MCTQFFTIRFVFAITARQGTICGLFRSSSFLVICTSPGRSTNPRAQHGTTRNSDNRGCFGVIQKRFEIKQFFVARECTTGLLPNLCRCFITNRTKQPTVCNQIIFVIRRNTNQTFTLCRIPTRIMSTISIIASCVDCNTLGIIFGKRTIQRFIIRTNTFVIFCIHSVCITDRSKRCSISVSVQQQTSIFRLVRGQTCFTQNKIIIFRLNHTRIKIKPHISRCQINVATVHTNFFDTFINNRLT